MTHAQLEELKTRIDRLEKRDVEELLTVLEIMSNVTFFGEIKRADCEYPKGGQCSLFYLQNDAKGKIPVATECRIPECNASDDHCHLEANNVTCTFCPNLNTSNARQAKKETTLRRNSR